MTPEARTRLRLRLRDLAAGAAFASMAISGSVPWPAVGVFAVALVLALARRRVLAGRVAWPVVGLLVAAAALFGSALRGGMDLVVAACTFAALITAQRMLSEPSPATDNQVHLTSLLMVSGGAALSGELLFAVCLAVFSLLASLSLGLGVLEGRGTAGQDVPLRPLLRRLALGSTAALALGAGFFLAFPRLSWNVAARRPAPGLGKATTGFSDRVRLGGGGTIKTNPRLVARATLTPDPGVARLDAYWVGRTFDTFDGREWRGRGQARGPSRRVLLAPMEGRLIEQRIELLPAYDARTLIALEPPVSFAHAVVLSPSGSSRASLVEVESEEVRVLEPGLGYGYQAMSLASSAAQPEVEPLDRERYLGLPAALDSRVPALAARVLAGERDPLRAARKLEAFLQSEYRYTLELPGAVDDPLADFLFERKAGHCEHFATALAVMLRSQGFPARVAAGFFGGERVGEAYVVRAGDAHAWAQVHVPGRGFVSVDATPAAGRGGQPLALLEWAVRVYEAIDGWWRNRVIDYSIRDQFNFARSLVRPPRGATRGGGSVPVRAWLAAALVALVTYGAWRWSLGRRGAAARPHPASALFDALERAVADAGLAREGEGLEELCSRLDRERHRLAEPFGQVTRRYLEARFGGRPLAAGELDFLVKKLRRALVPPPRRTA